MSTITPEDSAASGLLHMIYPYSGDQEYVSGALAYIERARSAGGTVIVAAPPARREALRGQLGGENDVSFVDTVALGRNPGRLIPAWQEWISQRARSGTVHGINETLEPLRSGAGESESRYQEWLLNRAFAQAPAWSLMCPVDTGGQPATTVEALTRCHPLVWNGTTHIPSADYLGDRYPFEPLPEPVADVEQAYYDIGTLHKLRSQTADWAAAHDLPAQQVRALTLAVSEVATNSIRYGGGHGTLRFWSQDGAVVCELSDTGIIADPLAGRARPDEGQLGGRGLWFVNNLCDLVEIRSNPELGTRIRLWIYGPDATVT
jgi:anti-sigma regulatory factor (Ser/Thr protein kinase)